MNSTDIANLALARLGVAQAIASLSEQSTPARVCNRFYSFCRQHVLRSHPWGFASTIVSIAAQASQTFPGWQYVYEYPDDGLMVWAVGDEAGIRDTANCAEYDDWNGFYTRRRRQPFKVAMRTDQADRVLLSDVPSAYAYYTHDVTNTGAYPVDFGDVLAWRLAMEVGGPLKVSADKVGDARGQFMGWMQQARGQDLNEAEDDRVPDSESIRCRY